MSAGSEDSPSGEPNTVAGHWDAIYASRADEQTSWFEEVPRTSLELLGPSPGAVVDIGAGRSRLVDELLVRGVDDVTVLDTSAEALQQVRDRVGEGAGVTFVNADVLTWEPGRLFDAWHDRAVLHFLTAPQDQRRYAEVAARAVRAGGRLVVATFAPGGPPSCSGLGVAHHDVEGLGRLLADFFVLEHGVRLVHTTPTGVQQPFAWAVLRRHGT